MKKHILDNFTFYIHKNEYTKGSWDKKNTNCKLIFNYQERQKKIYLFFFENGREHMRNESKNNEIVSNFLLFFKKKRKHVRLEDEYNMWETQKKLREKIYIYIYIYIYIKALYTLSIFYFF